MILRTSELMGWIKIQLKYLGFLKLFLFEYFIITHSGRRLYQYNEDESFIFNKLFSKYSYQEKLFFWKLRLTLCVYMPLLDKIKIKIRFNCIDIIAYNFIKPVILMFNINSLSLIKYGVLNKSNNDIFLRINVWYFSL